jgi:phage baseplate assembly protein W
MASIYLDNLIKPQKIQSPYTNVAIEPEPLQHTYRDLHLDLEFFQNIGNGYNPVISKDISADFDVKAIHNAIYNIFTTRPGEKILSPDFGCSLDQFLFEQLSDFKAQIIGNLIYTNLVKFEPRINVSKVQVYPNYKEQQYEIYVSYEIPDRSFTDTLQINFNTTTYGSVQIL